MSQDISLGTAVTVSGSEVTQRDFSLLSPRTREYVLDTSGQGVDVDFAWNLASAPEGSYVLIETSPVKRFDRITSSLRVTDSSEAVVDFPPGTTYYRTTLMSSVGEPLQDAFEGAVNVISAAGSELVVPAPADVFHYRSRQPVLRFSWTGNEYAAAYILEIAGNESMLNPAVYLRTDQTSAVVSTLGEGVWYWRVTQEYPSYFRGGEEAALASGLSSFTVERREELESPVLRVPSAGSFIDSSAADTVFSWSNSDEAVSYDLYLSDSPRGGNVLARINRVENFASVNLADYGIQPGIYYWYVTFTDSEGTLSPASEVRSFSVVEGGNVFRPVFPTEGFTISDSLIYDTKFTWKSNLPGEVLLEVATDRDFSNVVLSKESQGSAGGVYGISLSSGAYFWRIRSNSALSDSFTSSGTSFNVAGPLDAPRITRPAENGKVVIRPGGVARFDWETVNEADFYKVVITSEDGREVYAPDETESSSFNADFASVPSGQYTLTLQAEADETAVSSRRMGDISERHFEIRQLRPVVLEAPANGTVFDGVEAVTNPSLLRWAQYESASARELVIARGAAAIPSAAGGVSARPDDIVVRANPDGDSFRLPSLGGGTFYWKVLATTADNLDMSSEAISSFAILPIPNLPSPSQLTPENGTVFDVNYMRRSMSARLEWQSVPDATSYVLRIDKITADGSRERVALVELASSALSYNIEDLSDLDEGEFEWSVEAQQHLPDGTLLRSGDIASSRFSITLLEIQRFALSVPGELYGN